MPDFYAAVAASGGNAGGARGLRGQRAFGGNAFQALAAQPYPAYPGANPLQQRRNRANTVVQGSQLAGAPAAAAGGGQGQAGPNGGGGGPAWQRDPGAFSMLFGGAPSPPSYNPGAYYASPGLAQLSAMAALGGPGASQQDIFDLMAGSGTQPGSMPGVTPGTGPDGAPSQTVTAPDGTQYVWAGPEYGWVPYTPEEQPPAAPPPAAPPPPPPASGGGGGLPGGGYGYSGWGYGGRRPGR